MLGYFLSSLVVQSHDYIEKFFRAYCFVSIQVELMNKFVDIFFKG